MYTLLGWGLFVDAKKHIQIKNGRTPNCDWFVGIDPKFLLNERTYEKIHYEVSKKKYISH